MKKHTEARLEDAIVDSLTREGGFELVDYRHGPAAGRYDKALALDPALVLGFIQTTQPKVWHSLQAIHQGDTPKVVLDHLAKELDTKGMLKVLRQGFKCYGKKLRVAVFAPSNRMNPETLALVSKARTASTGASCCSTSRAACSTPLSRTSKSDAARFVTGRPRSSSSQA